MRGLIGLSRAIDGVTTAVGRWVAWGILLACVVAAGNAVARKFLGLGSNAWLEVQWLLFSAAFLFAAPWALKSDEHIRIDVLTGRLSARRRAWIDVAGHVLFLFPVVAVILWTSVPFAVRSFTLGEGSTNYGGLPQWPLKALIPVAFTLLLAQGVSETIKRIAWLRSGAGAAPEDHARLPPHAGG
jgi:TRAP-type mannitol/chloroaromatic compound transport system permease small subunit